MIIITKLYNTLKATHPEDAVDMLLGLLRSEKIMATAFDQQNDDHVIDLEPAYWRTLSREQAEQVFQDGMAPIGDRMHSGEIVHFQMHIFVPDFAEHLLPIGGVAAPIGTGSKRGRKEVIDWTVVWTGVAFIMSQPERPKNQDALISAISSWCEVHFGETAAPSVTVLKEQLFGLFRIIGGEPPKSVFPDGSRPRRKRSKSPANKKKAAGR